MNRSAFSVPGIRPNASWTISLALLLALSAAYLATFGVLLSSWAYLALGGSVLVLSAASLFSFLTKALLFDIFSPTALSGLTVTIYFALVLASEPTFSDRTVGYVAVSIILAVCFYFTFAATLPRNGTKPSLLWAKDNTRLHILSAAAGSLLFAALAVAAGYSSPVQLLQNPLAFRSFISSNGMSYFKTAAEFLILTPAIIRFAEYGQNRKAGRQALGFVAVGISYTILTGSRGTTVVFLIQILMIWHLTRNRIPVKLFGFLAITLIPFVAFMGEYRVVAASQAVDLDDVVSVGGRLDASDMLRLVIGRLDASFYLDRLIRSNPDDLDLPRYGETYASVPLLFVPRSVWPNKPLPFNSELTYRLVPGSHDATFDFSIFGETYANFLMPGCLVGGFLMAVITFALQSVYRSAVERPSTFRELVAVSLWFLPAYAIISGVAPAAIYGILQCLQIAAARMMFFKKASI